MPAERAAAGISDDAVLGGRLRLLQPRSGHRFGHDAILLAAATAADPGQHAVDLGAGVGAAGLALAARVSGLTVTLVEIDPELARLASENIARNGLADRVRAIALDVAAGAEAFAASGLAQGCADHVLMNPPFNDPARAQASPDPARRAAHLAPRSELPAWVAAASFLLRPGGTLTMIYRADAAADVQGTLAAGFGALAILPVASKPDAPPIRIVVRAEKGGQGPSTTCPALLLNGEDGRPTVAAERILRDGLDLPLDRPRH